VHVVDDLRVDVAGAAKHGQPRALRGPLDALAQLAVPLLAAFLLETDVH
jgi:hypothetical protein